MNASILAAETLLHIAGRGDKATRDRISSHMTENGSSLNNMFPRRHIIQQLGQIRRLRNAFKQTVQHAEANTLVNGKYEYDDAKYTKPSCCDVQ